MTGATYPEGWNCDYDLTAAVAEVLQAAECGWLQAMIQMGYVLAQMLVWEEDEELRVGVAEVMAAKLLETARTGKLPGEVVQ